ARTWEPLITLPFAAGAWFSADDQFVGRMLYRQNMRFWRLIRSREHRTVTGRAQRVVAAAVSPDGRLMAVADQSGAWLWDLQTDCRLAHLTDQGVYSVRFHPSGRALITSGPGGAHLWPIDQDAAHADQPPAVGPPQAVLLEDRPGHVCPGTSLRADLS